MSHVNQNVGRGSIQYIKIVLYPLTICKIDSPTHNSPNCSPSGLNPLLSELEQKQMAVERLKSHLSCAICPNRFLESGSCLFWVQLNDIADFQNRIRDSGIYLCSLSVYRIIYHLLRFYIQLHGDK